MAVEQDTTSLGATPEIDDFGDVPSLDVDPGTPVDGDQPQDTSGDGGDIDPDAASADQPSEVAEPVQQAASREPEPPAAPQFDPELLASVGMTADEAAAEFGSNEDLAKYDAIFNRRLLQRARAQMAEQQASQQPAAQQQADPGEPPTGQQPAQQRQPEPQSVRKPQPRQPADGEQDFIPPLPIERERWDDDTWNHLVEPMHKWASEQFRELHGMKQDVLAMREVLQQQAREQYDNAFEAAISELGADWEPVLGKGSYREITPESLRARQELDTAAQMLNQTRVSNGLVPLPLKRAVQLAAAAAFPDRNSEITRRTVTGQVLRRSNQFTARPSAKTTSAQTGLERAAQAADKFYEDRGIPVSAMPVGAEEF